MIIQPLAWENEAGYSHHFSETKLSRSMQALPTAHWQNKLKLHSHRRRLLFNTIEGGIKSAGRPIYVDYKFIKNKYIYTNFTPAENLMRSPCYSNCLVYSCVIIFTLSIVPISTAEVKRLEPFRQETLIFNWV